MAQVVVDPAVVAARSRRLARITTALASAFAVLIAVLWFTRAPVPAAPAGPVVDPLAARRQAPLPPQDEAAPAAEPVERPFVDPSGAAGVAYSAGDLPSSLAQFQAAVAKNPQDAESWSNMGQVLVKLNRAPEALPCFERAIAIIPDRWAYRFNMARALGLVGRLDESIAAYREAQRLFPDDYATAFNLALALHKGGKEAEAAEQYQKAIALSPEEPTFRIALGITYERLQRPADAAAAYTEALRLSPNAPDADKVRAKIARLTAPAPAAATAEAPPPPPRSSGS